MNLISPAVGATLLGLTLVPLLALYILRLRRTRRVIGSTIGWVRRTEDLRANTPFQRLRPSVLLLVQALLLALLALAAAQPVLRGLGGGAGRVVLLVDCSASMSTRDCDGRSRLEVAREAAVARAEALLGGGLFGLDAPEVMVVAFAGSAEVRLPFGRSVARVREAVETIGQTDEVTRLEPALELARAHAAGQRGDADTRAAETVGLEIFSDGRFGDAAEVAPRASERVTWNRVGSSEIANAGLAAAGVERSGDDPTRVEAFTALRNFASAVASRDVALRADGTPLAMTPGALEIPAAMRDEGGRVPGERRLSFAPFNSGAQRLVEIVTEPGDAFATDDRAVVALREARSPRLALVGDDGSLEALLAALRPSALERFDRTSAEAAIARDPAWADGFDVVVSVGAAPRDASRGRWLHFGVPPTLPGMHPFGEAGRDYARTSRADHPVLHQCNVNELVVRRANPFSVERSWTVLIEGGRSPLAAAGRTPRGFAVVVGFEPGDSNWPFQRSFVNFTAQAIELLAGLAEVASDEAVVPGGMIRVRVPEGVRAVTVTPPGGRAEPISVREGEAAWGPARRAGAYRVEWTGADGVGQSRWVAVNQLDPIECDVAVPETLSLGGAEVAAAQGGSGAFDAWPWALALAIALLCFEWWLFHRLAAR